MGRFGGILTNIKWLSCILIGCIFYGMVQISVYYSLLLQLLYVMNPNKFRSCEVSIPCFSPGAKLQAAWQATHDFPARTFPT